MSNLSLSHPLLDEMNYNIFKVEVSLILNLHDLFDLMGLLLGAISAKASFLPFFQRVCSFMITFLTGHCLIFVSYLVYIC